MASPSDSELMQGIVRRDSSALGALYDRHAGLVHALVLRILRNPADAEEVLVDVFHELWSRPERFDPGRGNPLAYLATVARSRAIDRLRMRRPQRELELDTDGGAARADPGADPPGPLADALLEEQRRRIHDALGRLSPEQRQAIELSFYEGLSHGQIASTLDQPLGTVKSRIRGGLIHLRDALRRAYGSGEAG